MHGLDKALRNKLENIVTKAREVAEEASMIVLEQLGVERSAPYSYLTEEQRELRRKLRTHGRQLGDNRDAEEETQEIERLIEEVAYEHWHRMLFARFLAENKLLMFYEDNDIDSAVAVTLEECEEMASAMGCTNGWELAARLAAKMLPQIFRPDSPVYMIHFSPEKQRELEMLLADLSNETFTASDSLGWVYQFWQTKKKREVNDAGNKIGARELPAVTQLFTEPYMVSFLLDNSLGAWWAKMRLQEADLKNALTEDELRDKASIPGVPLEYLRFMKDEGEYWAPAGGSFDGWPGKLSELKTLDPCCGSGHFLVSAFLMLVPMRIELEGLSAKEACDAVLRENIHGLEIDQRCVELAAFAVALTAWKYPNAGGFRKLPDLQIAWCGQSVNVKKEEWLALSEGDTDLGIHLGGLYNLFQDAPVLGSLINPRDSFEEGSIFEKDWERISKVLQAKLEKNINDDDGLGVVAQGMEKAFQLLGGKYHWVITNPPYLSRAKQNDKLRNFIELQYSDAKYDIATAFLDRCFKFCLLGAKVSVVLPQNWLFMKSYLKFRQRILKNHEFNMIINIAEGGFESPAAAGAFTVLICFSYELNNMNTATIDTRKTNKPDYKKIALVNDRIRCFKQETFLNGNDSVIKLDDSSEYRSLRYYADSWQGLVTTDTNRYVRNFWELELGRDWEYFIGSPGANSDYRGRENLLLWENGNGSLHKEKKSHNFPPKSALGKKGVILSQVRNFFCSIYSGEIFNDGSVPIIPKHEDYLLPIYCYCQSNEFTKEVRKITQSLRVTNDYFLNIPFDLKYWQQIAESKYPNHLPKPYSDDPTQWVFHGHPAKSKAPLQVAVARLLGYRWPAEMDKDMEISDEARDLMKKCDDLLSYADKDGIVCIPPVRGEASASERLLNLLADVYKGQDINAILSELLTECDHAGKSLDSWLREKFFTQHFKIFGQRPFIWHIWDGLADGFAALVNYHKLDRKKLEMLIYTYLGDWINKQKAEVISGVDGSQEKLAAAENLKISLELILHGESGYDIFIRWKPTHLQPIGWEPDINDGVRVNIRPFMSVPDVWKKGAGILRDKPNIKWEKDRGKDTELSPWYHKFNGDRINNFNLTLDEKKKAREEKR